MAAQALQPFYRRLFERAGEFAEFVYVPLRERDFFRFLREIKPENAEEYYDAVLSSYLHSASLHAKEIGLVIKTLEAQRQQERFIQSERALHWKNSRSPPLPPSFRPEKINRESVLKWFFEELQLPFGKLIVRDASIPGGTSKEIVTGALIEIDSLFTISVEVQFNGRRILGERVDMLNPPAYEAIDQTLRSVAGPSNIRAFAVNTSTEIRVRTFLRVVSYLAREISQLSKRSLTPE